MSTSTGGALLIFVVGLSIVLRTARGSGSSGGSHLIAGVRRVISNG